MKRPDITTPQSLFGSSARYKAPVFQRRYVWGKKEITALFEDIETADPTIGQFLGAIVLKDMGREGGPTSPSTYLLIDGQQRLTTLYLVLLGLARVAIDNAKDDVADFIWQNYLVETKSRQYAGWPKLVPTLQDRHTFYEILESALPEQSWNTSADPADTRPHAARKLKEQWERIVFALQQTTGASVGAFDAESFDAVLTTVQDRLKLIDITLEAGDDANATFSRLNASGVPLDLVDLVRNEVFSKFGPNDSQKANKFYLQNWQPFEKSIPDGHINSFFPVYAYIAMRGKVTKAAAFAGLQKAWKGKSPQIVLSDLQQYAPFFSALTEYRKLGNLGKGLNDRVDHLSRMPRTRVTWPFIIQVLRAVQDRKLDEGKAIECLEIVESFLVRRALVGREPTGLHAVFKVLWERTKGDPNELRKRIITRTILTPNDAELTAFLKKERSDSRVILGYILSEYERHVVRTNKYDPPPPTVATVEHVLPRNLAPDWAKVFSGPQHEKLVGLLGNLVPLSETQNKSLQDESWPEKRKRFAGSNFKTAQALAKLDRWTPEAIRRRTSELVTWIIATWPSLTP